MMKKLIPAFTVLFLLATYQESPAQAGVWKTLAKISFQKQYDDMMGYEVDVPVFGEEVRALEGKEITVKGYIIPVEGYKNHKEFVFSAYPYNLCFFCGGAGPETVMQVYSKAPINYTAEPIVIKGRLELNDSDAYNLMYALREAVQVDEME